MMPFAITKLPGEPILIVRIEFPLDQYLSSVASINDQLVQLTRASSSALYILIDLRGRSPAFSDLLIGMQLLDESESWIEQRSARPVLVGSDPMLGIAVKRARHQFGLDTARFNTLEEALAYARAEIAGTDRPDDE
jgi:hypothetical protein